jgi:RNA polymerase sigma-70 factor, ECF subfamily
VLPIDYAPAADPHDGPAQPVTESGVAGAPPDEKLGLEGGLLGPDARYEQREGIELAFTAALQTATSQPGNATTSTRSSPY